MATDILDGVTRRVGYLRSLTDRTESTTLVLDIQEGLRACALLRDYLRAACRLLWKECVANQIDDHNAVGQHVIAGFDAAARACAAVEERAGQVSVPDELREDVIHARADCKQAVAEIAALKQDFERRRPWLDEEKLLASIAGDTQGSTRRPAREVFDELRRRVR